MKDLLAGVGYLLGGVRWSAWHPRLWLFGLIPALVTLLIDVAVLVLLVIYAGDLITWATPFADTWTEPWRDVLRIVAGIILIGALLLVTVVLFTAMTLAIGGPFYDSLSERVERAEGGAPPEVQRPLWRETLIAIRESIGVLCYAAFTGAVLFVLGFIPVVGQTVVPVLGACVSGFFLTAELTSLALQRRGVGLRERMRRLRGRKLLAIGFGTPLFLLFLVPFVAVLAMPCAVAGATLLTREHLVPSAAPSA